MCDYYSNFIEVAHLKSTTSRCVIREMSEVFARFGVVDILVTDNAPNFTSADSQCLPRRGRSNTLRHHHITRNRTGNPRMRLRP